MPVFSSPASAPPTAPNSPPPAGAAAAAAGSRPAPADAAPLSPAPLFPAAAPAAAPAHPPPTLVYCHCEYARLIAPDTHAALRAALDAAGQPCTEIADLCTLAARRDPALAALAAGGPLRIAACQPRAVKWLFAAAGAPLAAAHTEVVNLRALAAPAAAARLLAADLQPNVPPDRAAAGTSASPTEAAIPRHAPQTGPAEPAPVAISAPARPPAANVPPPPPPAAWLPWFPVIDFDRCTQCMQCLSFCLFGVFGVDAAGGIAVQNPTACKTQCPACSRVCPEVAIVFPQYAAGPINGAEVRPEDAAREPTKVDLSALLGGDLYARLRQRSAPTRARFSPERDADQALRERRACLAQLAQAGDIPLEVLRDLPSPEEILQRAEAARAKAQAALAARTPAS